MALIQGVSVGNQGSVRDFNSCFKVRFSIQTKLTALH